MRKLLPILAVLALFVACTDPLDNNTGSTTYTVTFNSNHADVTGYTDPKPGYKEVSPNQAVDSLPTAPARANHNFVKWTANKDGTGPVFTETTPVNKDITVYAQWQVKGSTPDTYSIVINKTGDISGDSVAVSPGSGGVGASITITYTLADVSTNNRLVFSGTAAPIAQVNQAGTAARTYTVAAGDANESGVITINAAFTHTDKSVDEIAFEDSAGVHKVYGDPAFTRAVTNSGQGSGAIAYSSSNTSVATVTNAGLVTIHKAGDTTITATKAADATYEGTTAAYSLNIAKRQLTISDPTITPKIYDGTTIVPPANVTIGSLTNIVSGDVVTVVVNSAEYDTAHVGTNKTVTVFYIISGADADNYISPVSVVTGTITVNPSGGDIPPSIGAIESGNYRNLFVEMGGKTQQQVTARVNEIWNQLFVSGTTDQKIFIEVGSDMAYILTADTNDVRSEGMSYGMMMCVQMNDKTRFDKLWKWAYTNMYNHRDTNNTGKNIRGFFAWKCNTDGSKADNGPAPDGEFYFATALLFASARWGDGTGMNEYGRWARNILFDMLHRYPGVKDNYGAYEMFHPTYKLPVFTTVSSLNATYTDPSYILPAFFDVWALEIEEGEDYWDIWDSQAQAIADAQFYREAATAGRAFFAQTTNSTTGLGPDYASWTGAPTGSQQEFLYDAWRIAMNIAMDYAWWAKDPWQITHADRIQNFFRNTAAGGVTGHGALFNLNGTLLPNNNSAADHSPGLVGCNTVASLAASNVSVATEFVNHFFTTNPTTGKYRYYDGCLVMMSLLHVSGNFKAYFPANRVRSAQIAPTSALFNKVTSNANYKDVVVTMTLNGNTLSNIKNGNTTLVSGTNYTVSGSTVTIRKEYLATLANGAATLTFNFNAGKSKTISIAIQEGGGGSSYDFTNNSPVASVVEYGGSGTLTAVVQNGVLRVTKTNTNNSTPWFSLPFNLGSTNLSQYELEVKIRGVSGDVGNKQFIVRVQSAGTAIHTTNNVSIQTNQTSWTTVTQSTISSTESGEIRLSFELNNTTAVAYEIQSITLRLK